MITSQPCRVTPFSRFGITVDAFHEANAETHLGHTDKALLLITEVLRVTERGGAYQLGCRAKRLCGAIYERRGQPDRGLRYIMEAMELARAIGDESEEQAARMAMASSTDSHSVTRSLSRRSSG